MGALFRLAKAHAAQLAASKLPAQGTTRPRPPPRRRTLLQRRQPLLQPVQVLLQEVQAVNQAAVGAQVQLRLRARRVARRTDGGEASCQLLKVPAQLAGGSVQVCRSKQGSLVA